MIMNPVPAIQDRTFGLIYFVIVSPSKTAIPEATMSASAAAKKTRILG